MCFLPLSFAPAAFCDQYVGSGVGAAADDAASPPSTLLLLLLLLLLLSLLRLPPLPFWLKYLQ